MVLQRPPEPFHRVYSPPEPPPTARRSALFGFVAVVVCAVLAVAVGFTLGFAGGPDPAGPADRASVGGGSAPGPATTVPSASASASADAVPPAPPFTRSPSQAASPSAQLFRSVSAPCSGVSTRTLDRLVERRVISKSANTSLATCTFTSINGDFRWLRVETRVIPPAVSGTPVRDAGAFFGAQWDRAHRDVVSRTVSLKRYEGLGDEAYRWFKRDNGQPTVVGEVAVRFRNALITVSYSRGAPSKGGLAESERDCLAEATAVAREVLTTFR